jgi:hypothetical protein
MRARGALRIIDRWQGEHDLDTFAEAVRQMIDAVPG